MENVEAALAATTAPRVTAERIQAVIAGQPVPLPTDRREYGKGDPIPPDRFMDRSAPDIGFAISAMRHGYRVARAGWNGKGMWLMLMPGGQTTLPNDENRAALPFVVMSTVTGEVVPWLASQTDLLATDWKVL